jgi:Holliday junction resolvase RusA-like endonuclease
VRETRSGVFEYAAGEPAIEVVVHGHPAPQGSKRHVGRGIMVESSKHLKPWREAVKYAAFEVIVDDDRFPLSGPLLAQMVFTLRKPSSAPKRTRTWPSRMPDLSKLIRSTEDALTDAGVWASDALVIQYMATTKTYPGEDPDALATPGAVIRVWEVAS